MSLPPCINGWGDANKLACQKKWTAVEQFLQYVHLSIMDRQNGADVGLLFEERVADQQGHERQTVPFHFLS